MNDNEGSVTKAARALSQLGRGIVNHQFVRRMVDRMDPTEFTDALHRAQQIARNRTVSVENSKLRRDVTALADAVGIKEAFLDAAEAVVEALNDREPVSFTGMLGGSGTALQVEILLSDLQIGKLSPGYNTLVARKRLFEMGRAVLFQIKQKADAGYAIEGITLAMLGDIIESDKKHKNSARATDTGTAEQIFDATVGIFEFVVEPLARLGIPMKIICVTGNHDWDDHGLNMFQPGRQQLSWPLYKSMEMIAQRAGYGHLEWIIPEGSYAVTDFYGQHVLYEHGVGVSVTEASMTAHKVKRAEQEKKHLTYFRMGDKHTVTAFNSGQLVVNGAFFGAGAGGTEYSGIAGYSSVPAQWMGFHCERKDNRLSLYDSFVIQLDHIGE